MTKSLKCFIFAPYSYQNVKNVKRQRSTFYNGYKFGQAEIYFKHLKLNFRYIVLKFKVFLGQVTMISFYKLETILLLRLIINFDLCYIEVKIYIKKKLK